MNQRKRDVSLSESEININKSKMFSRERLLFRIEHLGISCWERHEREEWVTGRTREVASEGENEGDQE